MTKTRSGKKKAYEFYEIEGALSRADMGGRTFHVETWDFPPDPGWRTYTDPSRVYHSGDILTRDAAVTLIKELGGSEKHLDAPAK